MTVKVRKPYTIAKQRERLTEEEHGKFLEALRMHGGAWRKIEEHVGTKTAVQIRSHAQRFFSKVVKESNDGSVCSAEPIEIPPPRPKRKPTHPYPRKLAHPAIKEDSVLEHPGRSAYPNLSHSEIENQSLTSVLSTFVSDTMDSERLSTPSSDHTLSPSSSADGNSLSLLLLANDARSKNTEKSLGAGGTPECGTFKLFGTMVVVTNSLTQDSPFVKSSKWEENDLVTKQAHTTRMKTEPAVQCEANEDRPVFSFIPNLNKTSRGCLNFTTRAFSSEEVTTTGILRLEKSAMGFAPYQRCVAREMSSSSLRLCLLWPSQFGLY